MHVHHDARYALRLLRRSPGFASVVIITLALGIGATTAIFSVVHAALFKPLPFKDPDRLVIAAYGPSPTESYPLSLPQLRQWRDTFGVFDQIGGYFSWNPSIGGTGDAEVLKGVRSSASLLTVLGVEPVVGRLFTIADEPRSAEPVTLISEGLWRRRFAADEHIAGRRVSLGDVPYTIIGVVPATFARLQPRDDPRDVWAPLRLSDQGAPASLHFISTIARLKPGQSVHAAHDALEAAVQRADPDSLPRPRVNVQPYRDGLVMNSRAVLSALMGAVGFLLLITCANLANLMLSRSMSRRREIAVRLAVGAGRRRIITQVLTECIVLAGAGGAMGVFLAWMAVRAMASVPAVRAAGVYDLSVNWIVLAFAAAISVGAGVLFGLLPALRAGYASVTVDLGQGARVGGGGDRLRSAFVVSEVALTLVLLVGAGLLGRSLARLIAVDKGFSSDSVLTFGLSVTPARYPRAEDQIRFFRTVLDRLSHVTGVETVGLVSELPLAGGDTNGGVNIEGREFPPGAKPMAQKRIVSSGYFAAMATPIRQGREFTPADDARAPGAIVLSESFARRWFPGEDPIGRHVGFNWDMEGFQTVVGVVADIKQNGLDDPDSPAIYVSINQHAINAGGLAVRTSVPPLSVVPAIRAELATIDPDRPMTDVATLSSLVSASMGARLLSLRLVGAFALIGLLLATTGIYGVVSHATAARSREFGIRLALGAETRSVLGLVLRHGILLVGIGLAIGLAGALALGGVIRAQLFEVQPADPVTLAAVCIGLVAIALLACYLPARRATRVSPASVLRTD